MQNAMPTIGLEFRGLRAGDSIDDAFLASGWAAGKCCSFSAFMLRKRVRCDVIAAHPCRDTASLSCICPRVCALVECRSRATVITCVLAA